MEKCPFSERYLQIIWNERLLCVRPTCVDGRPLRVVSTGLWNRGKGPDFRGAAILLDEHLHRGDVEVHRRSSDWLAHGHQNDSAYDNVVLHVVWEDDSSSTSGIPSIPTFELRNHLQPSWEQFLHSVEAAFYPHAREIQPGACAIRWALTDDEQLRKILSDAGASRFSRHGRELLRRGSESGLEQSLYERVFEALGYSANRQQFRTLAQALPLSVLQEYAVDRDTLTALIFGAAGLLPDPTLTEILPDFREWLKFAWSVWWQSGLTAQPIAWNLYGGRPLNSVWRRLAAGVFWLHQCGCRPLDWLVEKMADSSGDSRRLIKALLAPLTDEAPWNRMRDFQHALPQATSLLGDSRRLDIALNVFLPLLGAKAEMEGDATAMNVVRDAWQALPRSQENHLMQDAIQRFLRPPSRWRSVVKNAAQQQGIMDIFQNFCLALDHDCHECPFMVDEEIQATLS